MLSRIQDSSRFGFPWGTTLFFIGCLIVSLPSGFNEAVPHWLGGLYPEQHSWLLFTAAFAHGFGDVPALVHLTLMTIIIWLVGPLAERLVGTFVFTVAMVTAMGLYHLLLVSSGVEGNGSSGVIWLCGPIIFFALRRSKQRGGKMAKRDLVYERSRGILFLMYIVVPLIMMILPYTSGWSGNPAAAFFLGNIYHAAATAVGLLAAVVRRNRIATIVDLAASVSVADATRSWLDRWCWIIWVAIDIFLLIMVIRAIQSN